MGKLKGDGFFLNHRGDWLHLLKHFDPALGLAGFIGLSSKAINKCLNTPPLGHLTGLHFGLQDQLLVPGFFKPVIAASIACQPSLFEMDNMIDRAI